MNKNQRYGALAATAFTVALVATLSLVPAINQQAYAKPAGIDPAEAGKLLINFNVLAIKKGNWDSNGNGCNGHRIFFDESSKGNVIGTIKWIFDPAATGIKLTDCDGVGDGQGEILVDEKIPMYIFVKVNGKAGSQLELICDQIVPDDPVDDLCLIDSVKINKGGGFTKVMQNMFNNEYAEVLWTLDCTNIDGDKVCAKHIQVRAYEKLA